MKSLIIGVTGCAGSHLADYLFDAGHEVFGTRRKTSSIDNIEHILNKIEVLDIDLGDKNSITKVFKESNPDQIYFLVSAKPSDNIKNIYRTNVEGSLLFFETLSGLSYRPRIVLVSGSAVYGIQNSIYPIKENSALFPLTHYGLAKVFQEEIARYYCTNHNMDIITARPFNHPGPREHLGLVCSDFAKQIIEIEKGYKKPVIKVGDLERKRDFTDVRDIVFGYGLLAEKGRRGETYNLCSSKAYSIKMILDILLSMSSSNNIQIEVDQGKIRPKEIKVQIGNHSKIFSEIGWEPKIPLNKTLEDILTYHRNRAI